MFTKCFWLFFVMGCIDAALPEYRRATLESCITPRIQNGRVRLRMRSKLAKFTCQQGYELMGNKYTTCVNGHWDVPLPVCARGSCSIPSVPNGFAMLSQGDAWMVIFCFPNYEIVGSSTMYCDGSKWNDTTPTCVEKDVTPKLKCNFEDASLCGWKHDLYHDFDWIRLNSKTPSSFLFTGPAYDHTLGAGKNGYFMYIESTTRVENDTARLISPVYDKSLAKNGCFRLYYHMYGKTCGGLRVYQKPDKITPLTVMIDEDKQKHLLFEMWGNQGDFWYSSVSTLKDFNVDFQIIIEGIRGSSFTSDIAIDDVEILQGHECVTAKQQAVAPTTTSKPTTTTFGSCVGRCGQLAPRTIGSKDCSCSLVACVIASDCCLDIFDTCYGDDDITTSETRDNATLTSEEAPKTLRLVSPTSESPKTIPVTRLTTRAIPRTTSRITTRMTTTTTQTTTTTTTTPKQTTTRSTTTSTQRTTPLTTTTTTKRPTTTVVTTRTTPKRTTKKSLNITTTTTKATKPPIITRVPTKIATPRNWYNDSISIDNDNFLELEKSKKEQKIENKKHQQEFKVLPQSGTSTGGKIGIIILVLAFCFVVALVLNASVRSTRVRIMVARLRGQRNRDPEVQYFTTDVDDDN